MKLLLDENLSRHIVALLQEEYPGVTQVTLIGLEQASDREIWEYARAGGYAIVTKDTDFLGLQSMLGYPPKIILLSMGNCTNQQLVDTLLRSHVEIASALAHQDIGLIEVY